MALAEIELVPFWYFVEDASSTVTFWPADVVSVKLDLDALLTVPTVPPAAGPERAFDPIFAAAVVLVVVVLATAELLLEFALAIP